MVMYLHWFALYASSKFKFTELVLSEIPPLRFQRQFLSYRLAKAMPLRQPSRSARSAKSAKSPSSLLALLLMSLFKSLLCWIVLLLSGVGRVCSQIIFSHPYHIIDLTIILLLVNNNLSFTFTYLYLHDPSLQTDIFKGGHGNEIAN